MEQHDDLNSYNMASNLQLHEIKPVDKGMSFGALLEKFYLNSEAAKAAGQLAESEEPTIARSFIDESKVKKQILNRF